MDPAWGTQGPWELELGEGAGRWVVAGVRVCGGMGRSGGAGKGLSGSWRQQKGSWGHGEVG